MTAKTNNDLLFRQKVEEIIAREVRPLILQHGGDISVKDVQDGNVWIVYHGACKTCPSAQITTEEVVEKLLRDVLKDELKNVYLVTETDPELLDFAKKLLSINSKKN